MPDIANDPVGHANDLRARILRGEEPSVEELNKAIEALIADRFGRIQKAETKSTEKAQGKPKKVSISLDDLV